MEFCLVNSIFKLLGEVRDIDYPKDHYESLEKGKKKLIKIVGEDRTGCLVSYVLNEQWNVYK